MKVKCDFLAAGANRQPYCACYDSCSSIIAYGSGQNIVLWNPLDPHNKGALSILKGHQKTVNAIRFLANGRLIVSGGSDNCMRVWRRSDLENYSYEEVQKDETHTGSISSLAVSSNNLLLSGSSDGSTIVWKIADPEGKAPLKLISRIVVGDSFYPLALGLHMLSEDTGSTIIAIGGTSKDIYLYTLTEADVTFRTKLQGHADWVRCLEFRKYSDNDGLLLASASQDRYIRLWKIAAVDKDQKDVPAEIVNDYETMLSNKIHPWEVDGQTYSTTFEALIMGHDDWIVSIAWHPSQLRLISASSDTSVMFWQPDLASGIWICSARLGDVSIKGASTATGASGGFWHVSWIGENANHVATIGRSGSWRLWSASQDEAGNEVWNPQLSISGHTKEVTDLSWEDSGNYILTTSLDQTTRLFAKWTKLSHEGWHELARPQIHGYDMICVASISASKFVSGGDEKVLRVFEEPKGVAYLLENLCGIKSASKNVLPQSASVPALGLSNKAVFACEVQTLPEDEEAEDDQEGISSTLGFSILSQLTEPPLEDHLQRHTLWPEVEKLYGHGYEISAVAVSHDKTIIATACKANTKQHAVIRLFRTDTWLQIKPALEVHSLTVTRLRFSPDDRYLLSVSRDRTWALWARNTADPYDYSLEFCKERGHTRILWDCAWLPSSFGPSFITGARDKTVRVWSLKDEQWECLSSVSLEAPITALDCSLFVSEASGKCFAVAGLENGQIHVFTIDKNLDLEALDQFPNELCPSSRISRLLWNPAIGKSQLAVSSEDQSLRVFSLDFDERLD